MTNTKRPLIRKHFQPRADVTLFHGDRLDLLAQIKKSGAKVKLVLTSPPYNVGKSYEKRISFDEYLEQQEKTISACVGILEDGGSICWQVGNYIEGKGTDKEVFPLDIVLYSIFKAHNLKLRNRIIWHFGHGLHENHRFSGRHETILWFTKDSGEFSFNLDQVRIPQKYPGKKSYRGMNKGKPSGNPKGKNPSDVWNIPNVKANHIEKTEHDCQFPIALAQRLILALTNPGDLVVDPYLGVGSAAVACVIEERRVAGSDIEQKYLNIARERIIKAVRGELRIRPLNKPVFSPDPNTTVANIPEEWKETSRES